MKIGVSEETVKGRSQKREIVTARQIFCWMARKNTKAPYYEIGSVIGRNNSTAIRSITAIELGIQTKDLYILNIIKKLK
jgi:chromosomal replication initiation ATPase DnaA